MTYYSHIDTNIYWNAAKKYLPTKIDILFVAESPPAIKDPKKKAYFYFENNYGSDILFATIMSAVFHVNYYKNPKWKEMLLRQFQKRNCFFIDAVPYPINRDRKRKLVTEKERIKNITENQDSLLKLLSYLGKKGKLDKRTELILLKKSVHHVLYEKLNEKYRILNEYPIEYPRWYNDPSVVKELQDCLVYFEFSETIGLILNSFPKIDSGEEFTSNEVDSIMESIEQIETKRIKFFDDSYTLENYIENLWYEYDNKISYNKSIKQLELSTTYIVKAPPALEKRGLAASLAPEWFIGMSDEFTKSINKIDAKVRGRILQAISNIVKAPVTQKGNTVKPLTGEKKGLWRYRIGDYRLIYQPDLSSRHILLLSFSARSGAYV